MLIMIAMSQHFLCEEVIYIFEKIKKEPAMVINTANTNSNWTAASLHTYLLWLFRLQSDAMVEVEGLCYVIVALSNLDKFGIFLLHLQLHQKS